MASFNKVILLGNLTKKPELRYSQDGNTAIARTSMAVNYKYREKEEVMFIDIIVFGKQAEILVSFADKGTQLMLEGRLAQSMWESEGQKHSKHEVIVNSFQLTGSKNKPSLSKDLPEFTDFAPEKYDFDEELPI